MFCVVILLGVVPMSSVPRIRRDEPTDPPCCRATRGAITRQGSSSRFAGMLWMLYYRGRLLRLVAEPQAVSVDLCKPIPWLGRSLHAVNPAHVIIGNSFPACHRGSQTTPRHTAGNGESKRESAP